MASHPSALEEKQRLNDAKLLLPISKSDSRTATSPAAAAPSTMSTRLCRFLRLFSLCLMGLSAFFWLSTSLGLVPRKYQYLEFSLPGSGSGSGKGPHPHPHAQGGRPSPCPHHQQQQQAHKAAQDMLAGLGNHAGLAGKFKAEGLGLPDLPKYFEDIFLQVPSPDGAREALKRYTSKLHVAGSDADLESALYVQREWADLLGAPEVQNPKELLFDSGSPESIHYLTGDWSSKSAGPAAGAHPLGTPRVWTDTYYTWLNYVKNNSLTLASPSSLDVPKWAADLNEDILEKDPTSSEGNRPFHGYSKPGAVSGPLVYAGRCTKDDFASLEKRGVQVKGAITLCRYGSTFRGLKVRASAEAGAVGCLIYSDPLEDGEVTEANGYKAYPDGPARQPSSVQRGSVQALSFYPGDPGTPGQPSYKNATRLDPEVADSLPKIPSLPISYKNAKPLLDALKGHGVNTAELEEGGKYQWVGKVPGVDEYWTGPSEDVAHLDNDMTPLEVKPMWNTYAFIPGFIRDEVVVTANHRDAWTFGGADPSSGTAALHELVAGLGALTKRGWRPLRSILIGSWDGEEYGLVGSTEFGEDYASWLKEHAVAYLNVDVAAAGGNKLTVSASPSLAQAYRDAGNAVVDPDSEDGESMLNITKVGTLGSGSDFSVFLQYLGVASADMGYGAGTTKDSPIYHYHSNYDSFYYMETFGDPGFKRIPTLAKLLGLVTMRNAQNVLLPLSAVEYVDAIKGYMDKTEKAYKAAFKAGKMRDEGKQALDAKSTKYGKPKYGKGKSHHAHGGVDFGSLRASLARLNSTALHLEARRTDVEERLKELLGRGGGMQAQLRLAAESGAASASSSSSPIEELKQLLLEATQINAALRKFEQAFIHPDGLKGRPWYKSLVMAPGRWRGYGATALPGLTEAITLDADVQEAKSEAERLEEALHAARRVLKGGLHGGGKGGREGHHGPGRGRGRANVGRRIRFGVKEVKKTLKSLGVDVGRV